MESRYHRAIADTITAKTGQTIIGVSIDLASTGNEIFGVYVAQGGKRASYRLTKSGESWNLETAETLNA